MSRAMTILAWWWREMSIWEMSSLQQRWRIWRHTRLCAWELPVQEGNWQSTMKWFRQQEECTLHLQRTGLNARRNRESEYNALTYRRQSGFEQTIGFFIIINCLVTFLKIHWFQERRQKGETNMWKFLRLILFRHDPTQWERKSDAHEALYLLFQRTGVPDKMIVDGSKEQVLDSFRKKCTEAGCRLKQTKLHSPLKNAAEGSVW